MDGYVAQIDKICDLADQYDALVMVDECHATGFIGATGRGSIELRDALGRVDIITGTLGKAVGGAMEDLPRVGRKSSKYFGSVRAPICSPIAWLRTLLERL